MQPRILEKALHAWPMWGELIKEARIKMNFSPALLRVEDEAHEWEKEIGWEKVIRFGLEALRRMGLPWYFGFYWLACFCADYERAGRGDFSRIVLPTQNACEAWEGMVTGELVKDRGIILLYHQGGQGGKVYPPYPFILETSFLFGIRRGQKPANSMTYGIAELEKNGKKEKVDGIFDINKNGNVIAGRRTVISLIAPAGTYVHVFFGHKRKMPSEFRIEFTSFLATDDIVDMAFRQVQAYREGERHYMSHPLLKYIGPAKVRTDVFDVLGGEEARDDIAQYQKGTKTFEDLVTREWQRELKRGGALAVRRSNKQVSQSQTKTTLYHRVRSRLQRNGLIPPRPPKGWRSRLKL